MPMLLVFLTSQHIRKQCNGALVAL